MSTEFETAEALIDRNPMYLALIEEKHLTREMCIKAVKRSPFTIKYIPKKWLTLPLAIRGASLVSNSDFCPVSMVAKSMELITYHPKWKLLEKQIDEQFSKTANDVDGLDKIQKCLSINSKHFSSNQKTRIFQKWSLMFDLPLDKNDLMPF